VPRLGRVPARPSFRLIAAMNPFDAVGTARVSQAIADRMCRIAIGYQDAAGRARSSSAKRRRRRAVAPAVELTRLTREHPQVRMGSSVRGAIDLVRLGQASAPCAGSASPSPATRRSPTPRSRAVRAAAARGGLRAHAGGDRARADRATAAGPAAGAEPPGKARADAR
jgi:MoxR-like ATPase